MGADRLSWVVECLPRHAWCPEFCPQDYTSAQKDLTGLFWTLSINRYMLSTFIYTELCLTLESHLSFRTSGSCNSAACCSGLLSSHPLSPSCLWHSFSLLLGLQELILLDSFPPNTCRGYSGSVPSSKAFGHPLPHFLCHLCWLTGIGLAGCSVWDWCFRSGESGKVTTSFPSSSCCLML